MTWMIWRQHRGELVGATLLLSLLGLLLLLHGAPMHHAYQAESIRSCQLELMGGPASSSGQNCTEAIATFEDRYARIPEQFATWLPFLPIVGGILVGAPLLAREFEQGTWQLVWTQGVTRRRWLAAKLAAVLGGAVAASVAFAAGISWWFEPLSPQHFTPEKFNHAVLVFPAYVVFGVALGAFAGALLRRTIAAAAVTIVGYLVVRVPLEFWVRPHYRAPSTTGDLATAAQGWVVQGVPGGGGHVRYQPDERFWQFQVIEAAILLAITAALIALTWRLILGNTAMSIRTRSASPEPKAPTPGTPSFS